MNLGIYDFQNPVGTFRPQGQETDYRRELGLGGFNHKNFPRLSGVDPRFFDNARAYFSGYTGNPGNSTGDFNKFVNDLHFEYGDQSPNVLNHMWAQMQAQPRNWHSIFQNYGNYQTSNQPSRPLAYSLPA